MELFSIGKIVSTFANKGEVKVLPLTDFPKRFKNTKYVYCLKKDIKLKFYIESVRFHKNFIIVKFKNINSISEAEKLKSFIIAVPKEDLFPLQNDEYYWHDLIGSKVFDIHNNFIGTVEEIERVPANDILIIKKEDNSKLQIPFVDEFCLNIDVKNKKIIVKIIPGFEYD